MTETKKSSKTKEAAQEEKIKAAEKKKVKGDYEKRLADVMLLKAMTDTQAWQDFYRQIQSAIAEHGRAVLTAEKTREIIQHQEGVKILRAQLEMLSGPVRALNSFCNDMPLFAQDFKTRAVWNEGQGIVELRTVG